MTPDDEQATAEKGRTKVRYKGNKKSDEDALDALEEWAKEHRVAYIEGWF